MSASRSQNKPLPPKVNAWNSKTTTGRYPSQMNPLDRTQQHFPGSNPNEWRNHQQQHIQLLQHQQLSQPNGKNNLSNVLPIRNDNRLSAYPPNYNQALNNPSQHQNLPFQQQQQRNGNPRSNSTSTNYNGAASENQTESDLLERRNGSNTNGSSASVPGGQSGGNPLANLSRMVNNKDSAYSENNSLFQGGNSSLGRSTRSADGLTSQPSDTENSDPYGLLGLLQQLKNPSPTFKGTDLTSLGLNLSSSESLYSTFTSPFSEPEAEPRIPSCYKIIPQIPSPHDKLSLFSDETLFYIFYSMPGDQMQLSAARELKSRDWSYHTELQLWFQRLAGTTASKTHNYELGSYVYFDIKQWGKIRKTNFRMEYMKLWS